MLLLASNPPCGEGERRVEPGFPDPGAVTFSLAVRRSPLVLGTDGEVGGQPGPPEWHPATTTEKGPQRIQKQDKERPGLGGAGSRCDPPALRAMPEELGSHLPLRD